MKKYIILLVTCLMFVSPVFAQKINTDNLDFNKMKFSETENPVAYKYFTDYANMLLNKIDFRKIKPLYVVEYRYKVCSDGTIADLNPMPLNYPYNGTKVDKYFQELLKNNPPPSYPENMEIGDVYIEFSSELDYETKAEIRPFRDNDGALYPGNHITISLHKKSIKTILIDKIFY